MSETAAAYTQNTASMAQLITTIDELTTEKRKFKSVFDRERAAADADCQACDNHH